MLGVAWPSMREDLGLGTGELGGLLTAAMAGYVVSAFASGALTARIGLGGLVLVSSVVMVARTIGCSSSPFLRECLGHHRKGDRSSRSVRHFVFDLWRSACRPAVLRRCVVVALVVGTLLSLLNQGDAIIAGRFDRVAMLRIIGNYLIPFVVANLGAMTSLPRHDR
jgi:hypothetical protein